MYSVEILINVSPVDTKEFYVLFSNFYIFVEYRKGENFSARPSSNMEKQCLLDKKHQRSIWNHKITVEPTALLFLASATISQNLQLNLLLDKACRVYNIEGQYNID